MKNVLLALTAIFLLFGCDDDSTDLSPVADVGPVESDVGPPPDALSADGGQGDAANISDGAAIDQGAQRDQGASPEDAGPVSDATPSPLDTGPTDDMGAAADMGEVPLDMGERSLDMGEVLADVGAVAPADMGLGPADAAAVAPQPEDLPPGYSMRCPPMVRLPNALTDEDLIVTNVCVVDRPVGQPFIGGMVHNVGQQIYCGVFLGLLTLDLANGNQTDNMLATIRGLVRVGPNGRARNTCVAPGQSAPFMQVVRFRDDGDAASPAEQVNFSVRGLIAETQVPVSTVTIDAIEAEATDENRMRFTGTLRNIGGGPAGVAPFMVTMVGMVPGAFIFDYQHASGLELGDVIPVGDTLDFSTWIIGADVEYAPLFTPILNWEDAPPPEEAPPGDGPPPEEEP